MNSLYCFLRLCIVLSLYPPNTRVCAYIAWLGEKMPHRYKPAQAMITSPTQENTITLPIRTRTLCRSATSLSGSFCPAQKLQLFTNPPPRVLPNSRN
ncbi:hypothetical protein GGS23DRAFT_562214 [Durotheca rogersii]|uniref:uncharacterized protein n=1 Tax=Durotheca rogersii TaxID=419775 RepID=UPI00222040F3|nr:uncharacterized protein GGS23DRAFT_562214 [Durotheca rogersii]KAI5864869.1 hypothetical protein GGS23DRAFT_562214 [Durotheca rogersii]